MDETLKTAYNIIKRKRYTHHFCENIAFTTAQEKYMIKLIRDGLELPTAVIDHVSDGGCNERFHILNEEYGCSCGYIIKKTEHHDHLRCTEDHMINNDLKCYHGNVYFPVDLWQNPFREFQPEEIPNKKNVEKFYEIIKQKRKGVNFEIPASDMCKYTTESERYLIKLITEGADITEEIMNHVADCCDLEIHILDEKFLCVCGFAIKRSELPPTHDFKRCNSIHTISNVLLCRKGIVEYSNEEDKNAPGHPLFCYRFHYFQRTCVGDMYDRLMLKRNHKRKRIYRIPDMMDLPQEYYLKKLLRDGQNIPIEIISHVIYGCDIRAHLLDENYGCCSGYVLSREEFLSHDFSKCYSIHKINERLQCCGGTIDILSKYENSYIFVGKPLKPSDPREPMMQDAEESALLEQPNWPSVPSEPSWLLEEESAPSRKEACAPLKQPNLPDDEEHIRIIVPAPPPPDPLD